MNGTFSAEAWEEFAVPAANAQCETLEAMRALLIKTRAIEEQSAETARLRSIVEQQSRELAEFRAREEARLRSEKAREDAANEVALMRSNEESIPVIPVKAATQEDLSMCAAIAATSAAVQTEAGIPDKEPAYMIGDLCHKIGAGFSMTAVFVAGLGFKPSQTEGRSKLYTQTQCAGIKAALIARIEAKL